MSKLNKLYIAIQLVLIWAIVFTIPNSLLLQVVLWINLLYTAYTLSFTDVVNDDLIESELNIKLKSFKRKHLKKQLRKQLKKQLQRQLKKKLKKKLKKQ